VSLSHYLFNIARCHSGVEMSTESDTAAVFDGVSGGGYFLFCLTVTKPLSLPGSFSHYAFADMTVGWWRNTCRRFEGPWCLLTQKEPAKKYYQNSSHALNKLL
jgi:hypothetical protein